jgi:hypothetical protein
MNASSSKKGARRKSRRKRLPASSAWGEPDFTPTLDDWARIEAAYGFPLRVDDRRQLVAMVHAHLVWQAFEPNAPFVDDAEEWLERVAAAANALFRTLMPLEEPMKRQASWHSETLIETNFLTRFLPDEGRFRNFTSLIGEFVTACALAKKDFPSHSAHGFEEGQTWNRLIRDLTKFAEERGMPTAASKGANKSASDRPSPFVAFVRELQTIFPPDSRRHDTSDAALARGISLARRTPDTGR